MFQNLLQRLLQPLRRKHRQPPKNLSPREKARTLVQTLQDETLECLRSQRHLVGMRRDEKEDALLTLAYSFIDSEDWHPADMNREDADLILEWIIRNIVLCTGNGMPIAAYEIKLHEIYLHTEAPETVPEVQNPWRSGENTGRRAGPRRRVSQS